MFSVGRCRAGADLCGQCQRQKSNIYLDKLNLPQGFKIEVYAKEIPDPYFGKRKSCSAYVPQVQNLGPHVASLGVKFYTGSQFPAEYQNQVFIAEHGSWNRSNKIGYRVTHVSLDKDGKATGYRPYIEGWLQGEDVWGRPVDMLVMPDGALLVSDDYAGAIYRVTYEG